MAKCTDTAKSIDHQNQDALSPEQAEILAAVLAQHPTLTREEALKYLWEAGM